MTDKAEEDGDGGMVCHVSEMNPQETVTSQTIYVTYGATTSGTLSEGDVFAGQFVLQAGDSDILASVFCGDVGMDERVVSTADDNPAVPGSFGYGTVTLFGDKERTDQRDEISLSAEYQPLIGCVERNMVSSSSGDKIQDDNTSRKSIFSMIRATISQEFLVDPDLFAMLEKLTRELRIELIRDSALDESCVVGTDIGAFCQLEEMITLNVKECDNKSTNTESCVEKCDRGVTCCLLTPQFTRSGREIRSRDYDIGSDFVELKSDVRPSMKKFKNSATDEGPKVKRKRGRPRKNPQKPTNAPSACDNFCSNIINELHSPNVDDDAVLTQKRDNPKSVYPSETPLTYEATKSCLDETNGDVPEPAVTLIHGGDLQSTKINGGSESRGKDYESRAPFKHCAVCSFRTKRESHLLKHIRLHERDVPILRCSQCSFSTTRKNHLTRHEMQHKSTVCRCELPGCEYRTDNARLLRRHTALHLMGGVTKTRPHLACPISNCTYRTHRAHLLRRHLVRHTAIDGSALVERYLCSACPYETRRREHYLRHVNAVHSEQCPYLCDHCGRGFKRKDSLAQHGFVHQERSNRLYQFECQTCNARFRSLGHLHDHQAKHSTERLYLCEICGSAFKTKAVQQKHVLSIHSKPRSHVCSICSKRFNTNYALRRHASSHVSKAASDTAAPVDEQPLSSTVQVAIIRGLPLLSVDHLRGGITDMDSRVVPVNINSGQILSQVVVGTSQVFVPQVQEDSEKDHPTS